jgi:hypothetical protein
MVRPPSSVFGSSDWTVLPWRAGHKLPLKSYPNSARAAVFAENQPARKLVGGDGLEPPTSCV